MRIFTSKTAFNKHVSKEIIQYNRRIKENDRFFTSSLLSHYLFKMHDRFIGMTPSEHFGLIKTYYFDKSQPYGYRLSVKIDGAWISFSYTDIFKQTDGAVIIRKMLKERWRAHRRDLIYLRYHDNGLGLCEFDTRTYKCDQCTREFLSTDKLDIHHETMSHKEIIDQCMASVTKLQLQKTRDVFQKKSHRSYEDILSPVFELYDRLTKDNRYIFLCRRCHNAHH